jgi:hypothetical protein
VPWQSSLSALLAQLETAWASVNTLVCKHNQTLTAASKYRSTADKLSSYIAFCQWRHDDFENLMYKTGYLVGSASKLKMTEGVIVQGYAQAFKGLKVVMSKLPHYAHVVFLGSQGSADPPPDTGLHSCDSQLPAFAPN